MRLIRIYDVAYRLDLDDTTWLREVVRAARTALPNARGLVGWMFQPGQPQTPLVSAWLDATPEQARAVAEVVGSRLANANQRGLRLAALDDPSDGAASPPQRALRDAGVRAIHYAADAHGSTHGVALAWLHEEPMRIIATTRDGWARVLGQLSHARSLREHLGPWGGQAPSAPAAEPAGARAPRRRTSPASAPRNVTPAPPPDATRDARRLAALSADHGSRDVPYEDDRDAMAWRGWLGGAWVETDCFDAAGRRYLIGRVAHPDEPRSPRRGELDARILARRATGCPLKVIAADLGLSVSGVSRRLDRAMRAVGLRTPAELAALFASTPRSGV